MKPRQLDRTRPYDSVHGSGASCAFWQDGLRFDSQGFLLSGQEDKLPPEPVSVSPPKGEPRNVEEPKAPPPRPLTPPPQEEDEDVTLENLHMELDKKGVKYHHRAGIGTLRKLLDGAKIR